MEKALAVPYTPLKRTVTPIPEQTLRRFLELFSQTCSGEIAANILGLNRSRVRAQLRSDPQFYEAWRLIQYEVDMRLRDQLREIYLNGVVEQVLA